MELTDLVARGLEAHPRAGRLIANAVRSQHLAHAYLLVGPRGMGKRDAALAIGRLAGCVEPTEEGGCLAPCGQCPSCGMPYAQARHHDLLVLDPLEREAYGADASGEGGREVPLIDRIREGQGLIALRPVVSRRKCWVIARADALSWVHQAALLKTVEEPPSQALLVLTAENPSALLPTILSRVQRLDMPPLSDARILEALGRHDAEARVAALVSGGRPEFAARFLAAEDAGEFVDGQERLAGLALSDEPLDALRAAELCRRLCLWWHDRVEPPTRAKEVSDEERVRRALDSVLYPLEVTLRDQVALAHGARPGSPLRGETIVVAGAAARARALIRRATMTRRAVAQNANTRLALESLFLGP